MPPRPMPRPLPRPIVRPPLRPIAPPAAHPVPYPIAVVPGCPPCPPCAVYGVSPVPPPAGKPYLFPIDEMPDAAPMKDLLPGFPPFRREDLVPEDEWSAFSGLGALTREQKAEIRNAHRLNQASKHAAHEAAKAGRQQYKHQLEMQEQYCKFSGGKWTRTLYGYECRPKVSSASSMRGLDFFGAGPDPKTMTCEKIIKGYEQNAYMAQFRVKAQHKANAAARVQELEPYYQQCKGKTTVTPEQPVEPPVDTRLREGELYGPFASETIPASHRVTGSATSGLDIDWKMVAGIVGAGVLGLIVLKTVKKKKSASSSTSHGLNFSE